MNNRLAELRDERRWTQVDLAVRVGVSRQTIISIEKGKYDPSLPLAFKIADAFELPLEQIFLPARELDRQQQF
ncbi:MAG: putative transcriptional regulator [Actinomycetota bacterium]|nr:putative transcriptional regulator [Actinomycetota bacterium]